MLELEFKPGHSIKSKCLKWIVEKILPTKTGEKSGTMYCLGCKDYTDSFKPQELKLSFEKNQTVLSVDLVNQDF